MDKVERVDVDASGEPFERPECEIALTTFQATEIGSVDAEMFGERLLRETAVEAVGAQVLSDSPLEVAFHWP